VPRVRPVLFEPLTDNKPGSTTAPRSGDGDRPQGDPKGEARSAE
jgi:hypothetical protein